MGLVLSALASITAQWLPNWNRGIDRIQRNEAIGIALQRIGADLAAAEYVPANRDSRRPLFDGSELSITFVRTAMGPNVGPGLDVVRLGETTDRREFVTVRSRAPFAPLPAGSSLSEQMHFGDPVVLLRAPFRLSFAYAGPDRIWKSTLARRRQVAGDDQADRPRCGEPTCALDFDDRTDSCPGARAIARGRTAIATTKIGQAELQARQQGDSNCRDRAGRPAMRKSARAGSSQHGFVIVAVLWILDRAVVAGDDLFGLSVRSGARWRSTIPTCRAKRWCRPASS